MVVREGSSRGRSWRVGDGGSSGRRMVVREGSNRGSSWRVGDGGSSGGSMVVREGLIGGMEGPVLVVIDPFKSADPIVDVESDEVCYFFWRQVYVKHVHISFNSGFCD